MDYIVTQESFTSLLSLWNSLKHNLKWSSIFILPCWLEAWWQAFGVEAKLCLLAVRRGGKIIGIAPLLIRGETASIVGSANVCDYLDFIVAPGAESDFFTVLLDDLRQKGINHLDLRPLRPDSTVLTHLIIIAQNKGCGVLCLEDGVSVELCLPSTWGEYLAILPQKQRHELRRKLRRLWEAGDVDYCCNSDGYKVRCLTDTFLKLFPLSREEKADFMTAEMASFFRSLATAMAETGLLKYGILKLNQTVVSIIMAFDYLDSMYLYNSAYDPEYGHLSVGLLSKALCIKECIERGKKRFDFLQGGEPYKYRLGGIESPLYSCQITIR